MKERQGAVEVFEVEEISCIFISITACAQMRPRPSDLFALYSATPRYKNKLSRSVFFQIASTNPSSPLIPLATAQQNFNKYIQNQG